MTSSNTEAKSKSKEKSDEKDSKQLKVRKAGDLLEPWLTSRLQKSDFETAPRATLVISEDPKALEKYYGGLKIKHWKALEQAPDFESPWTMDGAFGPIHFCPLVLTNKKNAQTGWPDMSRPSVWGTARFKAGEGVKVLESSALENLHVHILSENEEIISGVFCGLEMAGYSFKGRKNAFKKIFVTGDQGAISLDGAALDGQRVGHSANWSRHLVNLPPNELHPEAYAQLVEKVFSGKGGISIDIWDEKKLEAEKCGLLLGVGSGAHSKPRLAILKYRSANAPKDSNPVALVGKGITFDTGGLDIKPSSAMRLMKKDMGGSAAVFGAFLYAVDAELPLNIDMYLALAENAVSSTAFRPSDLITARNGKVIEIHNTDAEGRLVLADAIDVALTQEEKPEVLIDVATLTGAIKVALGSHLAGLFSNRSDLTKELFETFVGRGDDVWPMPLYQKYRSQMNSPFADMTNSVDGFGGAVTAALFLESFVGETPWAHLDIYSWRDSAEGAILESGGSGQAVQGLTAWLKARSEDV